MSRTRPLEASSLRAWPRRDNHPEHVPGPFNPFRTAVAPGQQDRRPRARTVRPFVGRIPMASVGCAAGCSFVCSHCFMSKRAVKWSRRPCDLYSLESQDAEREDERGPPTPSSTKASEVAQRSDEGAGVIVAITISNESD